jgi:hypothetical protein
MTTERIKEIQSKTAYPDSISVQQALLQVWNESEQEQLRIADVVGRSEQLEDFVKHLQNKYGVLLDQYTETIVEKYKSSN